jgi:hypothetical protein
VSKVYQVLRPSVKKTAVPVLWFRCGLSGEFERQLTIECEIVAEFFGVFRVGETALAAGFGFDFLGRKNEAIRDDVGCRIERLVLHFVDVSDGDGGVEFGLAGGGASGLELLELAERFFELAVETLLVQG